MVVRQKGCGCTTIVGAIILAVAAYCIAQSYFKNQLEMKKMELRKVEMAVEAHHG